jgi:hypothetical protein
MAKKPKSQKAKKDGKSSGGQAVAWVIAPILGAVAMPTLVLLIVGMLPTLVAFFIIDRHPAKYTTRTIGYLNFAGCLPYALDIWRSGGVWNFDAVFNALSDPLSIMVMYAAAATGWVVYYATPPVVAAYLAVTSEIKVKNFKTRQQELIEDWGRNVRYGAMGEALKDDDEVPDEPEAEPAPVESAGAS